MATGTQVPWTTPGGAPCCCITACPDLGDGPTGVEFLTATRFSISEETYVSLFAGGLMNLVLSGSGSATAVSIFNANNTCTASGSFGAEWEFNIPGNSCTFVSSSSNRTKISGTGSTPVYRHYLESTNGNYTVFFNLQVGGTISQICGIGFSSVAQINNRTVNNNDYPPSGGGTGSVVTSSTLAVSLPLQNITVPTTIEVFGTELFLVYYINNSGSAEGTYTFTPSAP